MFWILTIFVVLCSYLLGSVSFSYLAGKTLMGIDLREHGSGNLGSSNALRVLGKKAGAVVFLLDILKGSACVWFASVVCSAFPADKRIITELLAGISAILGHVFTVYLAFKGGKGVATACGVFLYLSFWPMISAFVVWSGIVWYTKYISLGSLVGACLLPLFIYLQGAVFLQPLPPLIFKFSLLIAVLIVVKHRSNIKRIIAGTENKIGEKVSV